MTVSNVHTFTLTRNQLITEALELTGTIDVGSPIPSEIMETCARSLNLYIKAWQKRGLFLHTYQPAKVLTVVGQEAYLLGPTGTATALDGTTPIIRPLAITDVRHSDANSNEPAMTQLSMNDYMGLTTKETSSRPTQYAYDPQLGNAVLYLWPSPSSIQTILFNYQKPVDDFTTDSDTAAVPVDWLQALTMGLAYTIAPKRLVPLNEQAALKVRYDEALEAVGDFEETSFFFQPG